MNNTGKYKVLLLVGCLLAGTIRCQREYSPVFPKVDDKRDSVLTVLDSVYNKFFLTGDTLNFNTYFPLNVGNHWVYWDSTLQAKKVEHIIGFVLRADGKPIFIKVDSCFRVFDSNGAPLDSVIVDTAYLFASGDFIYAGELYPLTGQFTTNEYNDLAIYRHTFRDQENNDWIGSNHEQRYCGLVTDLGTDSIAIFPYYFQSYQVAAMAAHQNEKSALLWENTAWFAPAIGKYYLEEYSNNPALIFHYTLTAVTINNNQFPDPW
jgi:hypothetical protein